MNSITIFMAQRIIGFNVARDFLFGGLVSLVPADCRGIVVQVAYIAVCWIFLYLLHRNRIYLKV